MTIMHSLYREPGVVAINGQTCTQCGQCAKTCPADVLTMIDGHLTVRSDSPFGCIACGHCMMVCPEGSIAVTGRGLSPGDLIPLPPAEAKATPEALEALMKARRSVRRFTDDEVAPEVMDRIVEMATSAPMGIPPWDVGCAVVQGRQKVQKLADEIIKGYEGFLRIFKPWVLGLMRPFVRRATYEQFRHFILPLAQTLVSHHRQGRDVLFWDAPAVLIFHHSAYADPVDATIPCTYAMLAAESFGLGTTMIGSAPPVLQRNTKLSREYGIPDGNRAALVLIAGYPAVPFRRAIRRRFTSTSCV
jgi:ferredoxin